MTTLNAAIRNRKNPDTEVPMMLVVCCRCELSLRSLLAERPDAEVQQHREREHDAGVAEGEEEPDGQRPLALGDQLAGGVVDRGDVVGVEGVPHAEGVGQRAGADAEDRRLADVVVPA